MRTPFDRVAEAPAEQGGDDDGIAARCARECIADLPATDLNDGAAVRS